MVKADQLLIDYVVTSENAPTVGYSVASCPFLLIKLIKGHERLEIV